MREFRLIRSVGMAFLLMLVIGSTGGVSAQEFDIAPARDISLLKGLGLPEINLVADGAAVTGLPSETAAGQYLVTLEDKTENEVESFFMLPPTGLTFEAAAAEAKTLTHDDLPTFFFDLDWRGGPNAYTGQTDGVVLNLTPGEWWVLTDLYIEADSFSLSKMVVTGTATEPAAVDGAVTVNMKEFAWDMPADIASGEQIWQLGNSGEQPHFFVLFEVPAGTTYDDLMHVVMSDGSASPVPGAFGSEPIRLVYDTSILSPNQSMLIQVGLTPGTYGMFCWFPDQETMQPHAMMGMANVFTVK